MIFTRENIGAVAMRKRNQDMKSCRMGTGDDDSSVMVMVI